MRARIPVAFLVAAMMWIGPLCALTASSQTAPEPTTVSNTGVPGTTPALTFAYHLATSEEITSLRAEFESSAEAQSDRTSFDHGTGLAPPTGQEWDELVGQLRIANPESFVGSAPATAASVDLAAEPFFPPVQDQGDRGTCAAWATTYYAYGYMVARQNNWADASTGNLSHLMSPDWTYNKVATSGAAGEPGGPWDGGSWPWDNANAIRVLGCAPMSVMPYHGGFVTTLDYGSSSAWRSALPNHIQDNYTLTVVNDATVAALKVLLAEKTPVVIDIEGHGLDTEAYNPDRDYIISSAEYGGTETNHAVCIVGYDDSIIENGEQGAFKIVNSWGSDYGLGGFFWLTYEGLKKIGNIAVPTYMTMDDGFEVRLAAIVQTDPAPDRYANITIGIGPIDAPIATVQYQFNGSVTERLPTYMAIDISRLYPAFTSGQHEFFVNISSSRLAGNIASFRIEEYRDGWSAGATGISSQALDLPTALISPGSAVARLTYVGYTAPNWEQALNATGLSFSSGGLTPWISVPYGSRSGPYCIQSGTIGDRDSSWLKLTLKQTGLLTFYWKLSSKVQGDTLGLRMDGEPISHINGTVEWTKVSLIVQAGEHTITWTYQKDGSGTSGEDAGFLDDLIWSPGKVIGEQDFEGGAGPSWTVGDLNGSNGLDHWGTEPYLDEYQGHVGWCAAVGVNSGNYPGYENSYTHYYDMGMESYLDFRLPAGKSYQYLAVDFLYHGSVLAINGNMVDYLYFEAHNASGWSRSWIMPSYTPYPNVIEIIGWHYVFVPISNDVDEVRLVFHSGDTLWDSFGMWIDEVRVIGYSESMGDIQEPGSQVLEMGSYTNSTLLSVSYAANDDGGSGIDYVELYCRAPGQTTYFKVTTAAVPNGRFTASPIDMILNGTDGQYQFFTVALDKAGNMEATSAHPDSSITLDRQAPTTSLLLNEAAPKAWYSSVSMALSATDLLSGVSFLTYSIEGGAWQEFTTNISISLPGRYAVQYHSQDRAGNWGPSIFITFSIENVSPTTTSTISGEQSAEGWFGGNAALTLSATDLDSGVEVTRFRMDDGPWQIYAGRIPMSANGSHSIEFHSIDAAGNLEPTRSTSFKVDKEAPATSIVLTGQQLSVGLYNGSVGVHLTSSDAESGTNNTYYRIDSGTWTRYVAPFSVSTAGAHSIQYYAVDRSGNAEAVRSNLLTIGVDGSGNVPGPVAGGDQTGTLGLIAIAALAVVVAVIAMKRRKR